MARIAKCESGFKQSAVNKLDAHGGSYGVFQINGANIPEAKRQGLDVVNKVEDNLKFAGHILNTQGINAWSCNKLVD